MTTRPAAESISIEQSDAAPSVDWLGIGAALITVVLWASAFVGIRAAGEDFSPGALAFGRLMVGSLILGAMVVARRQPMPRGRDLGLVIGAGVLWFGAYNLALNAAEQLVDAGTAAMLVAVGPLLIVIFAGLFLGEGFPHRLVIGCVVAFGGALVIGLATSGSGGDAGHGLGILLCLIAALTYAGGVTFEKPVVGRISALNVTFLACVVGLLVTSPFAPALVGEWGGADAGAIGWMVYLGAFPTAIAFTTWAFALGRTSAGRLGSTTYLVAPLAILLGWLILGEIPPVLAIAGGAVSIAGVVVARSR
jgi:drug/metabolite transporter (DMT)-like permease